MLSTSLTSFIINPASKRNCHVENTNPLYLLGFLAAISIICLSIGSEILIDLCLCILDIILSTPFSLNQRINFLILLS